MYVRYNDYLRKNDKHLVDFYDKWDSLKYMVITYFHGAVNQDIEDKIDAVFSCLFDQENTVSFNAKYGTYKEAEYRFTIANDTKLIIKSIKTTLEAIPNSHTANFLAISDIRIDVENKTIILNIPIFEYDKLQQLENIILSSERKYLIDSVLKDL